MNRWIVCVAILAAASANGETFTFANVSHGNATSAAAGEAQLRVNVTDAGSNRVNFRFYWVGSVPMSITDIYFDDEGTSGTGVLAAFDNDDLTGSGVGVVFEQGATPHDLPAGGNFQTSPGMSADSNSPVSHLGVNVAFPTEYLDISIPLEAGKSFANVIAAIGQGYIDPTHRGLRVGLHVQAIGSGYPGAGGSESFIIVPLPTAAWAGLGSLSLALAAGQVRRRPQQA